MDRALTTRQRGLRAACLGGLIGGIVVLVIYLFEHGTGSCNYRGVPAANTQALLHVAVSIGVADLALCAIAWIPLRGTDDAIWPGLNGVGAAVLTLVSWMVMNGWFNPC
jgi:hypothetical protein